MLNQRLILIVLFLPIVLLANLDYNGGSLSSMEGGLPPSVPTLIRIFDNAIINTYNTSYECTVSISSTDPEGDNIMYEILWDTHPLFEDTPNTIPIGWSNSDDTVMTTIPAEQETIYYWKARAKDKSGGGPWTEWSEVRSFTMDMEAGDVYWYQVTGAQFNQGNKENVIVEGDSVKLISGYDVGSLTSPPISFSNLRIENTDRISWSGVKWTKSSENDIIKIQIEYKHNNTWDLVPDSEEGIPNNELGLTCPNKSCFIDFSHLDTLTYNTIRIKANFTRQKNLKSADEPALEMWALGNIGDNVTIIEEPENPHFFALNKVKPNPSVGNIEINYQLPERTNVNIKVVDLLGREVRTLVKGVKNAGYYSLKWRGVDENNNPLPSGIYFLWMEAGNFKETQKILLIR